MIRDAIAARKPKALDLRAVDETLGKVPKAHQARSAFVIAAHLMANGRPDEAKRYWLMVSDRGNTNVWWRIFALSTLRDRYAKEAAAAKLPPEI